MKHRNNSLAQTLFLGPGPNCSMLTIRVKRDTLSSKHCSTTVSTKLDQTSPLHLPACKRKPSQAKESRLCSSLTSYMQQGKVTLIKRHQTNLTFIRGALAAWQHKLKLSPSSPLYPGCLSNQQHLYMCFYTLHVAVRDPCDTSKTSIIKLCVLCAVKEWNPNSMNVYKLLYEYNKYYTLICISI